MWTGCIVSEAYVNEGPRMKRVRPAPMGRAYRYQRRMAHIVIKVAEKGEHRWDRKFIRTDSGWASTSPGARAGSPSRATPKLLQEDLELKETLRERLKSAGVSSIEVDRPGNKLRVTIRTSRPGIIIGRKGAEIEKLKQDMAKKTKREVFIDIQEVHKPELDAQLVSRIDRAAARKARGVPPRDAQGGGFGAAFRLQGNQGARVAAA